jgi:hypothetical protein
MDTMTNAMQPVGLFPVLATAAAGAWAETGAQAETYEAPLAMRAEVATADVAYAG